ncbi:putative lipoprotein [Leptospira sp. serovar Kenya str. Sh9]|nr:hypothetical protein [Leptospira sp. serovar Kenya]EMK11805.1 putative lipoprotein [Leptospira sp. serovar Kenya str. Sh9]
MDVLKFKGILFLFSVSFLLGGCIYRDVRIPGLRAGLKTACTQKA